MDFKTADLKVWPCELLKEKYFVGIFRNNKLKCLLEVKIYLKNANLSSSLILTFWSLVQSNRVSAKCHK